MSVAHNHDFPYDEAHNVVQDVCIAALFVSCKIHDTLKKTRDVLMASYAVRFPERAAKAKAMGGEIDIDPNVSTICTTCLVASDTHSEVANGARPTAVAGHRTADSRNHLLQLQHSLAFPLCHQD